MAQGKVEEANHVKKQLPFRTLTANYRERRLAPSITRYNPVITLDIDDLEERQLEQTRTLINEDPHTLGSFLSPKGTATSCSSSCRRNTPGVCMTVSDRAR